MKAGTLVSSFEVLLVRRTLRPTMRQKLVDAADHLDVRCRPKQTIKKCESAVCNQSFPTIGRALDRQGIADSYTTDPAVVIGPHSRRSSSCWRTVSCLLVVLQGAAFAARPTVCGCATTCALPRSRW
jgi:hypothetical protein